MQKYRKIGLMLTPPILFYRALHYNIKALCKSSYTIWNTWMVEYFNEGYPPLALSEGGNQEKWPPVTPYDPHFSF